MRIAKMRINQRSLISAFVVCCLDSMIPLVPISKISNLYLASVAEQTGLGLPWLQTLKTDFLEMRLILKVCMKKFDAEKILLDKLTGFLT